MAVTGAGEDAPECLLRLFESDGWLSRILSCTHVHSRQTRILSQWHVWIFNGQHQGLRLGFELLDFSTEIFPLRLNLLIIFRIAQHTHTIRTRWG